MNHLKKAPGRVFLVAFLATAGLLASAAPGLAAEQPDPVAPLTASSPASPAAPTDDSPDDSPDDQSSDDPDSDDASGGGGWSDRNTSKASDEPGDSGDSDGGDKGSGSPDDSSDNGGTDPSDDGDNGRDDDATNPGDDSGNGNGSDFSDQGDPDDSSSHYGTKKQTQAEKAQAARSSQKAKALQHKAQKKAATAKKSSSAKQKKARAAAAKRMKQQAVKAARRAAAERAAEQRSAQQQRRAIADEDAGDNPRSGGSADSMRDAILDLTNRARKSAGCGSLRYSTQLEKSAQWMASDMSEHHYMSHNDRQGRNSDKRIRNTGFDGDKTGENLGEGFDSPDAVFKAWMNSPSHRRNILDCGFRILGVGFASSGGYWVQHFGG